MPSSYLIININLLILMINIKYKQLLQHTWYYVTSNKQINLLIYSQWSVWFAHTECIVLWINEWGCE